MHRLLYVFAASALLACAADLAPTGTLRATFLGTNPTQGRVDAKTGAISGPIADITRELARRLGVPFQITPASGVRGVIDAVKARTADIGFLAFDATRAAEVDFSQPYSLGWNSYLVRADSPIRGAAELDRTGIRIGAPKGDSGELYLSRTLKQAELKSSPGMTVDDAHKMLAASEIDAFATNRQRLTEAAARLPNVRVLPDNFFAVEQSIVVDKGDPAKVEMLNRLIDDLRSSGFLKAAIERAGLSGVDVAPARR
jgi:polar amino acid transport system substrate-binding protein